MDKADPKVTTFNNGATYFTFVEAAASKGAHNPVYAKLLLENAEKEWQILNKSVLILQAPLSSSGRGACS